ncbi:MAG: hypothetical protein PCFJNLEI_01384 [Verrucomicrobiae bacterium]|nr:hypothetical protein [Verrucomicrobiae bacterium]
MNLHNFKEIFGAEIQYFRTDPRYWETILERFKETGLRCVTTYVQWKTHLVGPPDKKHPAGILDFTGKTDPRLNLHRFLELVEKHGFNLNFRCGPFCCNEMVHGGLPPWLVLGDPNIMVWDYANRPTQGYWIAKKEGMQPSYLHPTYLDWCRKWFAETDKIIVPHLRANGGCITMLNLDNEISYIVKDSFLDSDYNPVNVGPGGYWEQFLHARKSRLRPAPRAVPDEIGDDLPEYVDWLEFKTWCMSEYIRRLRAMHEANGVKGVTFMTNFNPHRPEGVPTRMSAFEKAVGEGGIVGYDFYRGTFMSYSGYHSMARVLKLMNASLKYTWSAEFMSGTWKLNLGDMRVSDDHMRFMARCAVAHGCKAIAWFMFHDRDCWGDSPVSSHGHARPSLEVLRETRELLFDKIQNWDALVPQTDVAIIYDLLSHQHTGIGDPAPCADNDLHIGKPKIAGIAAGKASAEYEGLFRLVEQCGVQPGAVDTVAAPQRLQEYRLAFLPGSPVLSPETVKACRAFVKRGGILVVSGPAPVKLGIQCDYLAQEKPEEERLDSLAYVAKLIRRHVPQPHVRIRPETEVSWVDWTEGGGSKEYRQPRNWGSAVLHRGNGEEILFVLNHYPEAARFVVEFPRDNFRQLINLTTGEVIPVQRRQAVVDVDRKSGEIYELV